VQLNTALLGTSPGIRQGTPADWDHATFAITLGPTGEPGANSSPVRYSIGATPSRLRTNGTYPEGGRGRLHDDVSGEGAAVRHADIGVLEHGLVVAEGAGRLVPATIVGLGEGASSCAGISSLLSLHYAGATMLVRVGSAGIEKAQQQACGYTSGERSGHEAGGRCRHGTGMRQDRMTLKAPHAARDRMRAHRW